MKKITFVSLMSLLFLVISSTMAYFFRYVGFANPLVPLGIGFGIMVVNGIISCFAKTNVVANTFCFSINAVALGFCIRSWYMFRGFDNALWIMLLVAVACVVYLLLFYALLYIPAIEKHFNRYFWVFLILTLVAYLIVVFTSKTTFVSTFGYYVIVEIAFIFAMCKKHTSAKKLFRDVVVSTFSVLIVAIIMALIMLECDVSDGFDIGGGLDKRKSPKDQQIS